MKKYLGWDTSSLSGVVVAFDEKMNIIAEWSQSLEASKHSERLLWAIDLVLQNAGWNINDLNGIVIGDGPGSFTGLRIGITTAKILADQLSIPLYAVSSLELLREGAQALFPEALIVPCTDASKGEWFASILGRESAIEPSELIRQMQSELVKHANTKWMMVGQAIGRYPEMIATLPQDRKIEVSDESLHRIQPKMVAKLGFQAILSGKTSLPHELNPRYLRQSEAEVKLKKGLLPQAILDKPKNLL